MLFKEYLCICKANFHNVFYVSVTLESEPLLALAQCQDSQRPSWNLIIFSLGNRFCLSLEMDWCAFEGSIDCFDFVCIYISGNICNISRKFKVKIKYKSSSRIFKKMKFLIYLWANCFWKYTHTKHWVKPLRKNIFYSLLYKKSHSVGSIIYEVTLRQWQCI